MTKPKTAQPDTRRRRASTGAMMDRIMGLARRLPLTRQVLAEQLETATPAQMEFMHAWMNAEIESRSVPNARVCSSRPASPNPRSSTATTGRPCASPSTTGGRPSNPSTSSTTTRTWSCSARPAPARPTSPSPWDARPAGRESPPVSSPPPSSSCACCAPTRRTGSTGSSPRSQGQAPGRRRARIRPDRRGGQPLLFQVVTNAYERQSIVYTTNIEFSGWGRIFGDPNMAAAIIDRTVHHGRMIRFEGDSYRKTTPLMQ